MRWQRTTGEIGHLSCAREFVLLVVEGIRGVARTVWKNPSISLVKGNDIRSTRNHDVCGGVTECENELFHINRFFSDESEDFEVADVNRNGILLDN